MVISTRRPFNVYLLSAYIKRCTDKLFLTVGKGGCTFVIMLFYIIHCVKSVRIRSFSGPNAGKYGPEKLRIRTLCTQ